MTQFTTDEVLQTVGFLIRRCHQVAIGLFLEETAGRNLTPAQFTALGFIAAEPGMDQTRLTDRSALDRSSVTKCVERLEAGGMIGRDIHKNDRRLRRLHATAEGLALLEVAKGAVQRANHRLLAPLGEEKARLFLTMLGEIAAANNLTSRVPINIDDRH
jgi:DNA-binding MarR family transcriptional regulator